MCICEKEILCQSARETWTILNLLYEQKDWAGYRTTKNKWEQHRTQALIEAGILPPGISVSFKFYADWRNR